LRNIRFHDLRRGAIRTLRRAGLSEYERMERVGLRTRAMFDRYDIVDEDRLRHMGEQLEAWHSREVATTAGKIVARPAGTQRATRASGLPHGADELAGVYSERWRPKCVAKPYTLSELA
jgi:hypothetical protein